MKKIIIFCIVAFKIIDGNNKDEIIEELKKTLPIFLKNNNVISLNDSRCYLSEYMKKKMNQCLVFCKSKGIDDLNECEDVYRIAINYVLKKKEAKEINIINQALTLIKKLAWRETPSILLMSKEYTNNFDFLKEYWKKNNRLVYLFFYQLS